jgi:hypothetical protein
MLGVTWSFLITNCTVSPLETPFGSLIPLLQSSITRTYTHSQLFLTPLHMYTDYNHKRSWLQSLITLLHVYTGWLLSYQLLAQIITDSTSSHFPCPSAIETSLAELTSKDIGRLDISVPLINLESYAQHCYLLPGRLAAMRLCLPALFRWRLRGDEP